MQHEHICVPDSLYEYSVCCAVCVSFIISYTCFVMVHMELRSTVVMYFGSYDIGHVRMDFNEGFSYTHIHECVSGGS